MAQKFIHCLIITAVIAFITPVFCPAQPEEKLVPTYNLTGTIILLQGKTQIRILYETKNNLHFISDFRITDSTQIKGNLEIGSVVTVTFIKERLNRNNFRRVALNIEVIYLPAPEEAGKSMSGY
jgi:hypothetical protein